MKEKIVIKVLILMVSLFMLSAANVMAQEPCTADFDCNQTVDAADVTTFLSMFGRNQYNDPCPNCYDSPCPCTSAPVPKTGQTTSYATGDDGDLKKGVAWPNPRFTDNGDGTITDNLTGLIWLKEANCFGSRTWNNALSDSNGLEDGECGLTDGSGSGDWRLPNLNELASLLDKGSYHPALPSGHPFTNVQSFWHWTSTTAAENTAHAWNVHMDTGYTYNEVNKVNGYRVWPVRGGND